MLPRLPPVTRYLLLANIAIFLLQQEWGEAMLVHFALWPWGLDRPVETAAGLVTVGFRPWQLLSYAFLHGSVTHILFNMVALYSFGAHLERCFGTRRFFVYYFVCLLTAALVQEGVLRWQSPASFVPTLGASGAVFGLLLAFGLLFPREKVVLMLLPVPLPAWLFVILYALAELLFGVTGFQRGVAHFAHLGGMLGGYVLLQYWRRLPLQGSGLGPDGRR